jgi:uroporphyrinogen-III synthase
LSRTLVAAVGPMLAERLREKRVQINICPERGS